MKRRWAFAWFCLVLVFGCSRGRVEEVAIGDPKRATDLPKVEFVAGDWPVWRGANGTGQYAGPGPAAELDLSEHRLWESQIGMEGHASPIVVNDRIYVSAADTDAEKQFLLCHAWETGKEIWRKEIHQGGFMHVHHTNSQASATPAGDGERVFAVSMVKNAVWVTAVDLDGQIVWQKEAGPFKSVHGYGSSPAIYESLVIVSGDSPAGGFLAALHRKTGEMIWRTARPANASFASPIVAANLGGRDQLLLSGHLKVHSYDPKTGKLLWESEGPADTTANTLTWNGRYVFASGGYPQRRIMAISTDGKSVAWSTRQKVYVPSMLVVGDWLFALEDDGKLSCFEADTGKELWKKRIGGSFSASPIAVGDTIYVVNHSGDVTAVRASATYERIAKWSLGHECYATPVVRDGRILFRTPTKLICLGE